MSHPDHTSSTLASVDSPRATSYHANPHKHNYLRANDSLIAISFGRVVLVSWLVVCEPAISNKNGVAWRAPEYHARVQKSCLRSRNGENGGTLDALHL